MTELWTFSLDDDEEEKQSNKNGGLSVSQFFCKKKPTIDSEQYPFFTPFIVPHGLIYLPDCISKDEIDKSEEDYEEPKMCESFDKLFYLAAKNLGKSQSEKSKTRKKIPR
jgi:hypothetical protein